MGVTVLLWMLLYFLHRQAYESIISQNPNLQKWSCGCHSVKVNLVKGSSLFPSAVETASSSHTCAPAWQRGAPGWAAYSLAELCRVLGVAWVTSSPLPLLRRVLPRENSSPPQQGESQTGLLQSQVGPEFSVNTGLKSSRTASTARVTHTQFALLVSCSVEKKCSWTPRAPQFQKAFHDV